MTRAISIIYNITNLLLSLSAGIAVGMIIFSGLSYITSLGNDERMTKAKNTALYVFIGLAVILFAKVIVFQLAVQVSGLTLSGDLKSIIFGSSKLPTTIQPGKESTDQQNGGGKGDSNHITDGSSSPVPTDSNTSDQPETGVNNSPSTTTPATSDSSPNNLQEEPCVVAPESPFCGYNDNGGSNDTQPPTQNLETLSLVSSATGAWYDDNQNKMVASFQLNRSVASIDNGVKILFSYKIKRSNGTVAESKYTRKNLSPKEKNGKVYISSHFIQRNGTYSCVYSLALYSGSKLLSSLSNRVCALNPPNYLK